MLTILSFSREVEADEAIPLPDLDEVKRPEMSIGLLAPSIQGFEDAVPIRPIPDQEYASLLGVIDCDGEITFTNRGTRLQLALIPLDESVRLYLALLPCYDSEGRILAIYLRRQHEISQTDYARVGSYVAPDLLHVPLSYVQAQTIKLPRWIYVTRAPPTPFCVSISALIDSTSLSVFSSASGFAISGAGCIGALNDWGALPPSTAGDASLSATELEPTYILLQKKASRLGLLLALTVEPSKLARADRNLFSVKACVLAGNGEGDVPYTDDSSREAVQRVVDFWRTTKKDEKLPISTVTSVQIPEHGLLMLMLMCVEEPKWGNVDGENYCRYVLKARWKGKAME